MLRKWWWRDVGVELFSRRRRSINFLHLISKKLWSGTALTGLQRGVGSMVLQSDFPFFSKAENTQPEVLGFSFTVMIEREPRNTQPIWY